VGVLEGFGEFDVAGGELAGQRIGVGDVEISVPAGRGLSLVVGQRIRGSPISFDYHCRNPKTRGLARKR